MYSLLEILCKSNGARADNFFYKNSSKRLAIYESIINDLPSMIPLWTHCYLHGNSLVWIPFFLIIFSCHLNSSRTAFADKQSNYNKQSNSLVLMTNGKETLSFHHFSPNRYPFPSIQRDIYFQKLLFMTSHTTTTTATTPSHWTSYLSFFPEKRGQAFRRLWRHSSSQWKEEVKQRSTWPERNKELELLVRHFTLLFNSS